MTRHLQKLVLLGVIFSSVFTACDIGAAPDGANDYVKPRENQAESGGDPLRADLNGDPGESAKETAAGNVGPVSGVFQGVLLLGVSSDGELTGFYNEALGDDGSGKPKFTCSFVIHSEKRNADRYGIDVWYPEKDPGEVIKGEMRFISENGKPAVNLRLDKDPCPAMIGSGLDKGLGSVYLLDSKGDWEGIRVISSEKAFFHASPDADSKDRAYATENEAVRVLQQKGEWAEVIFVDENRKETRGWMKTSDFFAYKR